MEVVLHSTQPVAALCTTLHYYASAVPHSCIDDVTLCRNEVKVSQLAQ